MNKNIKLEEIMKKGDLLKLGFEKMKNRAGSFYKTFSYGAVVYYENKDGLYKKVRNTI